MIIGAILATWVGLTFTDLPGWLVITFAMLAGFLGGAVWGGIPGFLKAYFSVNEILSTVMMNAIAVQLMNFLLRGPMIDPSQAELASKIPQTARLLEDLPSAASGANPFASGRVDRGGAGVPGLCPVVADHAWIPHPGCGTKPARLALCRDQSAALHCPGSAVQWRICRTGRSHPGVWCQLSDDHRWFFFRLYGKRRVQWHRGSACLVSCIRSGPFLLPSSLARFWSEPIVCRGSYRFHPHSSPL